LVLKKKEEVDFHVGYPKMLVNVIALDWIVLTLLTRGLGPHV